LEAPDIDNQKKYFNNRTHLFKLSGNNDLINNVFNKKKGGNKNSEYFLYYVPLTKDIQKFLKSIHEYINHRFLYYFKNELLNRHYFYKRVTNDFKKLQKNALYIKRKVILN